MKRYTDERRNSEGYLDITAYLAINNSMENETMYKGQVFKTNDYEDRFGVVLQDFGDYVSYLRLVENRPKNNPYLVKLTDGSEFWTDLGRVGYIFISNINDELEYNPVDNFARLIGAVATALEISTSDSCDKKASVSANEKELNEEIEKLKIENEKLKEEMLKSVPEEDFIRQQAKTEVFENLYKELLNKTGGMK